MLWRAGDHDTICALSTPPGVGGIAVIRVSGASALTVVRKICRFLPDSPESHRVYYGILKTQDATESLDEVLVSYFAEGRSFTGEETVEISCHGGEAVTTGVLKELINGGSRLAARGEFTYRAFMNGRLDLVQAESVLSLIESRSSQAAKIALRQLQGELSTRFSEIEDGLVWMLAHLEASIDFSTEDIEVVADDALLSRANGLKNLIKELVDSYDKGRLIKDGLEIALIGKPNVGKSSLLNAFLGEERAIVTAHAGTTRDTIEGRMMFEGVAVTFVDTAGMRETDNEIEQIGIKRSISAKTRADLVFHVVDLSSEAAPSEFSKPFEKNEYVLVNKIDLDSERVKRSKLEKVLSESGLDADRVFWVSARSSEGMKAVKEFLKAKGRELETESSNIVTQARHLELLLKIQSSLDRSMELISEKSSPEFIAFELQEAVRAIHELLGKEFDEQVIDRIFKEFCLGK